MQHIYPCYFSDISTRILSLQIASLVLYFYGKVLSLYSDVVITLSIFIFHCKNVNVILHCSFNLLFLPVLFLFLMAFVAGTIIISLITFHSVYMKINDLINRVLVYCTCIVYQFILPSFNDVL
jgi:hypothetical protein